MKKILFTLFICLAALPIFGQEYKSSYHSTMSDMELTVRTEKEGTTLIVQVPGEYKSEMVVFMVKDIPEFYESMCALRDKYVEWKKAAEENNVAGVSKEFDIKFPKVTVAWRGADWRFAFNHSLNPKFIVLDSGACYASLSGKVTSSSNRYIDQKYYLVVDEENFAELLDAINPEAITKSQSEKKNLDDIFK